MPGERRPHVRSATDPAPRRSPRSSAILIGCALAAEVNLLRSHLQKHDVEFLRLGIGPRRAIKTLEEKLSASRPRLLIVTGTAGALDPTLAVGEVVFPKKWIFEEQADIESDPEATAKLRAQGWKIEGLGLTVSQPIFDRRERRERFQSTGARICDMECGAALRTACQNKVPAIALKVVSDSVDDGDIEDAEFKRRILQVMPRLAETMVKLLADLSVESTNRRVRGGR